MAPTDHHPDDEALSAYVDDSDADAARHVTSCATCAARVETFRTVASAVGAPPAAWDGARRDEAIAAALAAADAGPATVDLAAARADRAHRRRGPSPAILAVAAVVLALLVAVPVLLSRRDSGSSGTFAAKSRANRDTSAAAPPALDDLGVIGDEADLQGALQARLGAAATSTAAGSSTAAGAAAAPAAGAPGPSAAAPSADAGSTKEGAAAGAASSGPNAPATAPPPDPAAAQEAVARCEAQLRGSVGDSAVRYRGFVTYAGAPAVVLGFAGSRPGVTLVFVLGEDDCHIIVSQRFGS